MGKPRKYSHEQVRLIDSWYENRRPPLKVLTGIVGGSQKTILAARMRRGTYKDIPRG